MDAGRELMKPRIRSAWYLVIAVCQSPGIEDEFDGMVAARDLIRAGVFAVFANNDTSVLQFLPPLTILDEEVEQIIAIARATL